MRRHWDWIVAYLIPGPVWRWWMRWVFQPIRHRDFPWTPSACENCPDCLAAGIETPIHWTRRLARWK